MKRLLNLIMVAFVVILTFSSCKDDDYATKIVGTYVGYSELKIQTNAEVVIAYQKENMVTVCYDTDMDDDAKAATTPVSAKVKKSGDTYIFSGKNGVESFNGTVDGKKLNLKVYVSGTLIYDITAKKR